MTPRETAEMLVRMVACFHVDHTEEHQRNHERRVLADRIEAALNAERESCALIAEQAFEPAHTYASENADDYRIYDAGQRRAMAKIAAAIRNQGE